MRRPRALKARQIHPQKRSVQVRMERRLPQRRQVHVACGRHGSGRTVWLPIGRAVSTRKALAASRRCTPVLLLDTGVISPIVLTEQVTVLRYALVQDFEVGTTMVADDIVLSEASNLAQTSREHVLEQGRVVPVPVSDLQPGWELVEGDQGHGSLVWPEDVELREWLDNGVWRKEGDRWHHYKRVVAQMNGNLK